MDYVLSILSSIQLPINNSDNQVDTSATIDVDTSVTMDADQQQMVKTLGVVRLTDDGKKFYKPDVPDSMKPIKVFKMMKELFGGFDEVGATSVDCKNFRRGINLFIGKFDVDMLVELLLNRQNEVAKHNYLSFDDVISFDATFLSKKCKMVFIPFTKIDNHYHSVTFAAAVLSNKTAESYGWLLRAFKKAFGRESIVVVNDQDPSMKIATKKEFSNSKH
nr:hypothetical protein [Tanacetum cinerariifolium]